MAPGARILEFSEIVNLPIAFKKDFPIIDSYVNQRLISKTIQDHEPNANFKACD